MLILVAHGTRRRAGMRTIWALAEAVSARLGHVNTAFVDVAGPNPAEVLAGGREPATVVPAFLASGFHVHTDLPARIRESGHRLTFLTPALGPDPRLAEVMGERLNEVGRRSGDTVVMAAAGSSDPRALSDVSCAAAQLADQVGEVHLGYVATGSPRVHDVVSRLRSTGRTRILIASYLLAPGLFHDRLGSYDATAVAPPLGTHPKVVDVVARRFADAEPVPDVAERHLPIGGRHCPTSTAIRPCAGSTCTPTRSNRPSRPCDHVPLSSAALDREQLELPWYTG